MRYLRTVLLFLIVFVLAAPVLAEEARVDYSADFEKFASGQSAGLDKEWNEVVGKVSGGKVRMMSPVFEMTAGHGNGRRASRPSGRVRMRQGDHFSADWSGNVSSGGFIHKGMTGQFMPNVTRERSGASRGMGMTQSPAARLKGTWSSSFNASEFTRSGRFGSRAAARKSPRMGTRRSSTSSGARTGKSSFGRAGTSRSRRRR